MRGRLLLEELLEARSALEGAEAGGPFETLFPQPPEPPSPPRRRDRGGGADDAAEEKVERSPALPVRLHGTIVP
jgi:hypothetical protein